MKTLFTFIALSLGFLSTAQAADCVPQSEMRAIAQHFTQYQELAERGDYCYDGSQESHLIAGLMFMRGTKFNSNMQRSRDELFSGRFAGNWYEYFIGRITDFEIDNGCPKGVAAYVYSWGSTTMYACAMALTDNFTSLDLASIFMHEARHIDGYPHITCSRGPRQGLSGACDNRISDGGSYAVSVETYAQLARYADDVHPALKAYARSASVIYADEAFDTPVRIDRSQRFLVMANDKSFYSLQPNGTTEKLGMSPDLGNIVMRGQHMIIFPQDKNVKARFLFARGEGEIAQQAGDQAAEYNGQTPAERAKFVDLHLGTQWNMKVYQTKATFACNPRAHESTDLTFNGETPVGVVYLTGYDRAAKTVQLMMASGKVFDAGCAGTTAFVRPSASSLDQAYKSIQKVGELTLGLTADGSLREIQGASSRPFSAGALDGKIFELSPNQAIEFYSEK